MDRAEITKIATPRGRFCRQNYATPRASHCTLFPGRFRYSSGFAAVSPECLLRRVDTHGPGRRICWRKTAPYGRRIRGSRCIPWAVPPPLRFVQCKNRHSCSYASETGMRKAYTSPIYRIAYCCRCRAENTFGMTVFMTYGAFWRLFVLFLRERRRWACLRYTCGEGAVLSAAPRPLQPFGARQRSLFRRYSWTPHLRRFPQPSAQSIPSRSTSMRL